MIDDRLIDDVARELTATELPAPLRAGVMSALDAQRPAVRWRHVAPMAAAAAILAVAMNAYVARLTRQPVPAQAVAEVAAAPAPPANVNAEPSAEPPVASPVTVVARRIGLASRDGVAPTAEELAWQTRAVPPLAAPAALALAGSQPVATVAPLLDVTPLVTEPLDVAPLNAIEPISMGGG